MAGAATDCDGACQAPGPGSVGWLSDDMRRLTDMLGIAAPQAAPPGVAAREKLDTLSAEFEGLLDSQLAPEEQQQLEEEERLVRLWRCGHSLPPSPSREVNLLLSPQQTTYECNAQHFPGHTYMSTIVRDP